MKYNGDVTSSIGTFGMPIVNTAHAVYMPPRSRGGDVGSCLLCHDEEEHDMI
jgi:hypothetical protein